MSKLGNSNPNPITNLSVLRGQRDVHKELFHPQPVEHGGDVGGVVVPLEAVLSLVLHPAAACSALKVHWLQFGNVTEYFLPTLGRSSPLHRSLNQAHIELSTKVCELSQC